MSTPFTDPEFCPNPLCVHHLETSSNHQWFYRIGYHFTNAFGKVQRYRCRTCGHTFSDQTFSLDYHIKHPVSYEWLFDKITGGSGVRGTGRTLGISHQAVTNRIGRLARQAMALHAELTGELPLAEDLATDGFESFVHDQYMPNNIHTLVGADSQFFYAFDYAHLRRKGRMTEKQKEERTRREQEYIRQPISITESFTRIIDEVEQLVGRRKDKKRKIVLDSDKKEEYRPVIERADLLQELKSLGLFEHRRTHSKEPRTRTNPLFPANYLERQFRKDNANQVRETMQFSNDVNNCMERMAVYQMYHNYFKPYRVDSGLELRKLRHGEVAGISRERIDRNLESIFKKRRFHSHVKLSFSQLMVWSRMVGNRDRLAGGYSPHYVLM